MSLILGNGGRRSNREIKDKVPEQEREGFACLELSTMASNERTGKRDRSRARG
jgi:hypothetical protein